MTNVIYTNLEEDTLAPIFAEWLSLYPNLGVLALLPEAEKHNLTILQSLCLKMRIPLVGGIFPALVTIDGFVANGVALFRFNNMPPCFLLSGLNQDDITAGNRISTAVINLLKHPAQPLSKPTLFLLFDAMLPDINSIIDQLYLQLADRVRYVGANAGSETFLPIPCLFDNQQVIEYGVLGMLLPDILNFSVEHGYPAPEHVMMASSSENNKIISIDWTPAFEMYQFVIKKEYNIELTQDNFYNYAVHYPFGILRANGDVVVRIPVSLTEDGSIYCIGEVPENTMLTLLRAPDLNQSKCIDKLLANIQNTSHQQPLLTFYCAGRRMHLGGLAVEELYELEKRSNASIVLGALSLGEIGAHESDYPIFHNAALICISWPDA